MKCGYVGLTEVYTSEVAIKHNESGDAFRERLNKVAEGTSMWWTGIGSLYALLTSFLRKIDLFSLVE